MLLYFSLCAILAAAQDCSSGIGPTCGPFAYTPETILKDKNHKIPYGPWPPEKQGMGYSCVEDPFQTPVDEPVNMYGDFPACPSVSARGLLQYGHSYWFPANFRKVGAAPLARLWGRDPALYAQDNPEGTPLPKTNVSIESGFWGVIYHSVGGLQYDYDQRTLIQKWVSWGWIVISSIWNPGELSFLTQSSRNPALKHYLMQNRLNAFALEMLQLGRGLVKFIGNHANLDIIYWVGESVGAQAGLCATVGCGSGFNVRRVRWPQITFYRPWDPSDDSYLNYTDFIPFKLPKVSILSQNAGGVFGESFREWDETTTPWYEVNSLLRTYNTSHEMGASIDGCQNSRISLASGASDNVIKYYGGPHGSSPGLAGIAANFWNFYNQSYNRYCGPPGQNGFVDAVSMMPLQVLFDIITSVDLNATSAIKEDDQEQLVENFKVKTWENIQETDFQGQKYFFYYGNQHARNCSWNETANWLFTRFGNKNLIYSSYPSYFSKQAEIAFLESGVLGNFQTCYRCDASCAPCTFTCYYSEDADGNPIVVEVQASRADLSQDARNHCPDGDC